MRRTLCAIGGLAFALALSVSANAQNASLGSYTDAAGHRVQIQGVTTLNADGSIGSGGGSGGTSTAAAPAYTEGAPAQPLSMNLTGDLRVISKQSGAWNVGIAGALPAGSNTIGAVTQANPAAISSGQQTLTTSAAALPTVALTNGLVLTALSTNTGTVYVGPSGVTTSTGYPLSAGQSISYAVTNQSAIYIVGTNSTDKVAFTGN